MKLFTKKLAGTNRAVIASIALALIASVSQATADDSGLVKMKSAHSVAATLDKLAGILGEKGMNVFARINHAEGAAKAGMELRPTELLIFGNPKVGTPLMKCSQSIAIDLPQKMLAWEDESGQVWLAYNNPEHLKARHSTEGCDEVFGKVAGALGNFAKAASQ